VRGVFVTGTGTEVGKTVVAAFIASAWRREGRTVAVFKPALTGLEDPGEPDHELLRRASGSRQGDDEIAPYRFGRPLSPHLAAELGGVSIEPSLLLSSARTAADAADALVCEGVGGLLVPLRPDYLVRDLARDLGLPLVIAASPGLGTINHTLLTLEAARSAELDTRCVVLTPWSEEPTDIEVSNRETIAAVGDVAVATMPPLDMADPDTWPTVPPELASALREEA